MCLYSLRTNGQEYIRKHKSAVKICMTVLKMRITCKHTYDWNVCELWITKLCMLLRLQSWNNRWFPSCISPLFQSKSYCEAFHLEISFSHMQIWVHLNLNKTNFHMKDFTLGLAFNLKQRRKAPRKSPISLAFKRLIILRSSTKMCDQNTESLKMCLVLWRVL